MLSGVCHAASLTRATVAFTLPLVSISAMIGRKTWRCDLLDASELYIDFPKWSIKRGSITVANVEMHVIDELELWSRGVGFGECTCGLGKWCTGSGIEAVEIIGWDPGT